MRYSLAVKLEVLLGSILSTCALIFSQHRVDKGDSECTRGKVEKIEVDSVGDIGAITSYSYPKPYLIPLYHGISCEVVLTTCRQCHFEIKLEKLQFPECTEKSASADWCIPGCDHIHFYEIDQPYRYYTHKNYFHSDEKSVHKSVSSQIRLLHCMSNASLDEGKNFKIKYQVVEKRKLYEGSPDSKTGYSGYFTSPNFPHRYALNGETFTYSVKNSESNGYVFLVSDDWDIAPESKIKVVEEGQPTVVLTHFEWPVIISKTSSVRLEFSTGSKPFGCCHNIGFKFSYRFLSEKKQTKPRTDCSAILLTKTGDAITFRGAATYPILYDCVWVIKRYPKVKYHYGLRLMLKEILKKDVWKNHPNNSLEIREGVNSMGRVLAKYTSTHHPLNQTWDTDGDGFYIRMQGTFYRSDTVRFIYTATVALKGDDCPTQFRYLCFNLVCISKELLCDKVDHCGDNSDESPALQCSSNIHVHCSKGFVCDDKQICLDVTKQCDGEKHCQDGTDEDNCDKKHKDVTDNLATNVQASWFVMLFCVAYLGTLLVK